MSLETFCDLVWTEIYDDCPAMGDRITYREIMEQLFIDGEDPSKISWTDHDGKLHRLSDSNQRSGRVTKTDFQKLSDLQERIRSMKAATGVVLSGDG